jgi:hypothetical protein
VAFYVSNTAPSGGEGTSIDPWRPDEIWAKIDAHDHDSSQLEIIFLDGTYQGADYMINSLNQWPDQMVGGNATNSVYIHAETDGGVILDGQDVRESIRAYKCQYIIFEGFDCHSNEGSGNNGGSIKAGGSNHLEFKRMVAYDASMNNDDILVSTSNCTDILFQDVVAFGTGQKCYQFQNTGNGTTGGYGSGGITIHRCWGRYESSNSTEPKITMSTTYDTRNMDILSCIMTWNRSGGDGTQLEGAMAGDATDDTDRYIRIKGCIAYLPSDYDTTMSAMFDIDEVGQFAIENLAILIHTNHNSLKPLDLGGTTLGTPNCTADDLTIVGGAARVVNADWTTSNIEDGDDYVNVSSIWESASGAQVNKQYDVDGTLGTTDLFPWPMQGRLDAALSRNGDASHDIQAEVEALSETFPSTTTLYYVSSSSPGGTGIITDPDRPDNIWSVIDAHVHSTSQLEIIFLDGIYQGADYMINSLDHWDQTLVGGTADNYVYIHAQTDGGVTLDGQVVREPCRLYRVQYVIVEGFNFHNGGDGTGGNGGCCKIGHVDSNRVQIRRVCAWDAHPSANEHVFSVSAGSDVLFQDCCGFGTGRKIFSCFSGGSGTSGGFGGGGVTYHRCWGRWEYSENTAPKITYELTYNYQNVEFYSCLGTHDRQAGADPTQHEGIFSVGNSDHTHDYVVVRGVICYLPQAYTGVFDQAWKYTQLGSCDVDNLVILFHPDHSGRGTISMGATDLDPDGLTGDNITVVGGAPTSIHSDWDTSNIEDADTYAGVSSIWESSNGAQVNQLYDVDGNLTSDPIFPWPMQGRLSSALATAGYVDHDIQSEIEALSEPLSLLPVYYLSPLGSDGNSGAVDSPWLTFNHAANTISEYATIIIGAGTYTDAWTTTPPSNTTWRVETGDVAILQTAAGNDNCIRWAGNATNITVESIDQDGFTIDGVNVNVNCVLTASSESAITNCTVTKVEFFRGQVHNIFLDRTSTGWTFTDCHSHTNQRGDTLGHCFYTTADMTTIDGGSYHGTDGVGIQCLQDGGTRPSDVTIKNVVVYDFGGAAGIYIGADGTTGGCQIYNCVVYDSRVAGLGTLHGILFGGAQGVGNEGYVYSNTIYNVGGSGIHLFGCNGAVARNNVIHTATTGIGTEGAPNDAHNSIIQDNRTYNCSTAIDDQGVGSTVTSNDDGADPLFTDVGADDFTLQVASPCIDTGQTLGSPWNVDILGAARPLLSGYDQGAYEATTAQSQIPITSSDTFSCVVSQASNLLEFNFVAWFENLPLGLTENSTKVEGTQQLKASSDTMSLGWTEATVQTDDWSMSLSSQFAPGTTTPQLTAPATKTTGDHTAGRIEETDNPTAAIDIGSGQYTELEWCIVSNLSASLKEYQFRVVLADGTIFDTYTEVPELLPSLVSKTVNESLPFAFTENANALIFVEVTASDSVAVSFTEASDIPITAPISVDSFVMGLVEGGNVDVVVASIELLPIGMGPEYEFIPEDEFQIIIQKTLTVSRAATGGLLV